MKLKEFRKMYRYTQYELGKKVGASAVSISLYENGKQMPDLIMLQKLADAFGISTDELLGHNQPEKSIENETMQLRERLRTDPSFRILFSAAQNAKPDHIRAAAAVLNTLKGGDKEDNVN